MEVLPSTSTLAQEDPCQVVQAAWFTTPSHCITAHKLWRPDPATPQPRAHSVNVVNNGGVSGTCAIAYRILFNSKVYELWMELTPEEIPEAKVSSCGCCTDTRCLWEDQAYARRVSWSQLVLCGTQPSLSCAAQLEQACSGSSY